ncbi:hypothetical protein G7Y89_g15743 [Cudoniella acicularis]|uniref:Uncharacterized protein n=1 Tax=Cudoniella acicularis TaxID=354080 RepID=A0A8H4VHJ7_9HELO|nr:hypothetical protein G7Y89_g15743 [Cudoniella acicularis]
MCPAPWRKPAPTLMSVFEAGIGISSPAAATSRSRSITNGIVKFKLRKTNKSDEKAEQERRRAEDKQRNRKETDERAEQERKHAEEADERAEQERRRAEDKQRNRQEAEPKTRPTTFEKYIHTCYTLPSKPYRIQTDKSLSTQGSITSPKNKPCPTLSKASNGLFINPSKCFD